MFKKTRGKIRTYRAKAAELYRKGKAGGKANIRARVARFKANRAEGRTFWKNRAADIRARLRTMPVEGMAARAVNSGFARAETKLHGKAMEHASRLERIAAARLGAIQGYATTRAMTGARRLHTRIIGKPHGLEEVRQLGERLGHSRAGLPSLAQLSAPRSLRKGSVPKSVDYAARGVLKHLEKTGGLRKVLLGGKIEADIVRRYAGKVGFSDAGDFERVIRQVRRRGSRRMRRAILNPSG